MRLKRIDLSKLYPRERSEIVTRSPVPDHEVRAAALQIVQRVREGGDTALIEANRRYGGARPMGRLRVEPAELSEALDQADPAVVEALERAAANIRRCHEIQLPSDQPLEVLPGVRVDRRWTPLRRVGVYVPGGKAAYPSSLLMGAIPAQVAGVEEIVIVTPADRDGVVSAVVLAAAGLLGIHEVYVTGGAQAVAALAYGTETIRRVDKIVGPGNAWVTAAKMAVFGDCAIDLPAGPSEAVIVADHTAHPRVIAADLLCQAEHGPDSPVTLVTTEPDLVGPVLAEIDQMLPTLERESILRNALGTHGMIVLAPDRESALRFVDDYGPEHLSFHTADPRADAEMVPSAGSVFLGPWSPESAGDYATGANHVLPTGGLARTHGPLSVDDFGSWRQVQELTRDGLDALRPTISTLATAEGLTAHRRCVEVRFEVNP